MFGVFPAHSACRQLEDLVCLPSPRATWSHLLSAPLQTARIEQLEEDKRALLAREAANVQVRPRSILSRYPSGKSLSAFDSMQIFDDLSVDVFFAICTGPQTLKLYHFLPRSAVGGDAGRAAGVEAATRRSICQRKHAIFPE
jgi:hypothetical protein